ncbi:MAG: hypothetical protein Q8K18_19405 [Burkholderiales bacterium]|nr:hypothetical protein [Burkholderiales bacterium]
MNELHDYTIAVDFRDDIEADSVTAGELQLIRAYLPDILKELTMLAHKDEE